MSHKLDTVGCVFERSEYCRSRLTRVACLGGLTGVMGSSVGVYCKDEHVWGCVL